jgi:hypothetical protein
MRGERKDAEENSERIIISSEKEKGRRTFPRNEATRRIHPAWESA